MKHNIIEKYTDENIEKIVQELVFKMYPKENLQKKDCMDRFKKTNRQYYEILKDVRVSDLSPSYLVCDYDVKSIAEQVGLARATFYKYDVLQKYVVYSKVQSRKNNPYAEIERLKQIIQEQKDTISLFEQRDCNMMLLEEKNQQQAKIIQEQNDTIERLKKMKIMKFSK